MLDTRKAYLGNYSAISIAPDCTLNITGNGTLTTIGSFWPSIVTHGACKINSSGENTVVKAYGMQYETTTPFAIQESWDNSGMLVGHWKQPVSRVLMTLDITPEVIYDCLLYTSRCV